MRETKNDLKQIKIIILNNLITLMDGRLAILFGLDISGKFQSIKFEHFQQLKLKHM